MSDNRAPYLHHPINDANFAARQMHLAALLSSSAIAGTAAGCVPKVACVTRVRAHLRGGEGVDRQRERVCTCMHSCMHVQVGLQKQYQLGRLVNNDQLPPHACVCGVPAP